MIPGHFKIRHSPNGHCRFGNQAIDRFYSPFLRSSPHLSPSFARRHLSKQQEWISGSVFCSSTPSNFAGGMCLVFLGPVTMPTFHTFRFSNTLPFLILQMPNPQSKAQVLPIAGGCALCRFLFPRTSSYPDYWVPLWRRGIAVRGNHSRINNLDDDGWVGVASCMGSPVLESLANFVLLCRLISGNQQKHMTLHP